MAELVSATVSFAGDRRTMRVSVQCACGFVATRTFIGSPAWPAQALRVSDELEASHACDRAPAPWPVLRPLRKARAR